MLAIADFTARTQYMISDLAKAKVIPEIHLIWDGIRKRQYWVFWYQADHRYGLPTVAFFLVAIALFTLGHWVSVFAPRFSKKKSGWPRVMAIFRILSYKRWWVMARSTHSIGALLLAAAGVVFFLDPDESSILAAKANPIALLTGISHEKLTSWHNWVAWAMFVLALVHTFPFIVYHTWKGDLVVQWNDGGVWVTGVVALLAQAWLTFASVPWLRNRYYEFFKSMHHLAALVFIIFLFFHCDFRLSSWDYFIATTVLYSLSWCYSQCRTYFEYGVSHKARLQRETNDMLKVTINTSTAHWTVGQHVFLRFLAGGVLHMLATHPFTICSIPKSEIVGATNTLVFYIRPRGGLTKSLMAQATNARLSVSDQCLVVGGGAGAGFTLSFIEHYIRYQETTGGANRGLKVIIATRELDMRLWYNEALRNISTRYSGLKNAVAGLSIDIHETGQNNRLGDVETRHLDVEKAFNSTTSQLHNEHDDAKQVNKLREDSSSITKMFNVTFFRGRPNMPLSVQQFVAREECITTGLIVCGPSSMAYDVGEAAVSAQQQIIKGEISAKEVWFHAEGFSY
ncbi:hypothetical protein UA08_03733 [Talaromyces atroroseus]|uniref:ferric-chelate reductase (NADPH) n=1 Tax=Talaromyces atroroseus TaxID=1441469 RepID=A0A225AUA7_TALAT|nr:hypothetical protein UA08_03733 [Talaromyces atroroseus]OKL60878.1 hypothetical protein UA08_03733 [Talaromyces atroroseus]